MASKSKTRRTDPHLASHEEFPTDISGVTRSRTSDEMHFVESLTLHPEAFDEAASAFLTPQPSKTYEEYISDVRQRVNAGLARGGWPPGERMILVAGDKWELLTEAPPEGSGHVWMQTGYFYTLLRCEKLSDEWFLAKIAEALFRFEHATGDHKSWAIHSIARLLSAYEHRVHYLGVRKSVKQVKDAVKGGIAKGSRMSPRTFNILHEMSLLRAKHHSIKNAALLCALRKPKVGTSARANEKLWDDYKFLFPKTRTPTEQSD